MVATGEQVSIVINGPAGPRSIAQGMYVAGGTRFTIIQDDSGILMWVWPHPSAEMTIEPR